MTYTEKRLEDKDWKAESYKKWRATDLVKSCKPWEGAVHQYFVNEIIEPLLQQTLVEERERVVMEIRKRMPSHDAVMEYLSSLDKPLTDK